MKEGLDAYPSIHVFREIAKKLNVSADYLLGLVDYPTTIVLEEENDEIKKKLLLIRRAYKKMTKREIKVIKSLVNEVIEEEDRRNAADIQEEEDPKRQRDFATHRFFSNSLGNLQIPSTSFFSLKIPQ